MAYSSSKKKKKKKEDKSKNNQVLYYDILERMLMFLPVKSLLRFKSVCKQFRDLISSPMFEKSHLYNSVGLGPVSQIHMSHYPYRVKAIKKVPWSISIPSIDSKLSDIHIVENDNPFAEPIEFVLGSCNGLLLVVIRDKIYLWNPSIRECVQIFPEDFIWNLNHLDHEGEIIVGLGYNSVLDEYKVVLFYANCYPYQCKRLVYSSRTGSWKKVAHDFPFEFVENSSRAVTVNGCPHWIISKYECDLHDDDDIPVVKLIYFDTVDDKFKSLSAPDWLLAYSIYLGLLGGSIYVTKRNFANKVDEVEVWVMTRYGVEDSWTKLFVISDCFIEGWVMFRPVGFMKNGDEVVLVLTDGKIVTFNLKTKEQKIVVGTSRKTLSWTYEFNFAEYSESLVSPRRFAKKSKKGKARRSFGVDGF